MLRFLSWFKKYFTVFLALGLVVAAVVMTVDFAALIPEKSIVGEGKGENVVITTQEEFDALAYNALTSMALTVLKGEDETSELAYQSITVYCSIQEEFWEDEGGGETEEELKAVEYLLAITSDVLYLKVAEEEKESSNNGGEHQKMQKEYFVKGSEVYVKMSEWLAVDDGVEISEDEYRGNHKDELDIQMRYGELREQWVHMTDTTNKENALNEVSRHIGGVILDVYDEVLELEGSVFNGGEEPRFTLTIERQPDSFSWEKGFFTLQYKYINNTVIEDITAKETYDSADYM